MPVKPTHRWLPKVRTSGIRLQVRVKGTGFL